MDIIERFIRNPELGKTEYVELLRASEDRQAAHRLAEEAVRLRKKYYGNAVYVRGLIEFTNYCRNDCFYCGIRRSSRGLERYRLTEEEKGKTELTRFGGKVLNGLSLSGKLQGMGWYRGSVQDAGVYTTFYREDGQIGVELEFSGSYVGDENEEVTVYGASFYRAGTVKRGSYVYDTIKKENLFRLDEVAPRYFSETVLQLTRALASSREQLPYPECRE